MNRQCEHCNALHFPFEQNRNKQFLNCCHQGKINLSKDPDYPKIIEKLATENSTVSKNFRKHIRSYNNALAFASFGATYGKLLGKGPDVIRINARELFDKYKIHFYRPTLDKHIGENYALKTIQEIISKEGFSLKNFDLPNVDDLFDENINGNDDNINIFDHLNEKINMLTQSSIAT
jgi:hypothetical protein